MGASIPLRSRRAVMSGLITFVATIVILSLAVSHHSSQTPISDRLHIPPGLNKKLESYFKTGTDHYRPKTSQDGLDSPLLSETSAASNATLGFSKILAIHMKHRWDKWDASMIQSYISGLDLTYVEAVDGKTDIADAGRVGLPPMSADVTNGPIACYRSHANIWADLVRTKGPPVMVFESDAAWDVNIREIMGDAHKIFLDYLSEVEGVKEHDPEDIWQSKHWDVITLGHCMGGENFYDESKPPRGYNDKYLSGEGKNRMIHRSNGWVCTTAYAVSHRGAAKMLLRHAFDLNSPFDLIVQGMIGAGELVSYAINPGPVVQWDYHDNIGMKGGANSDLYRIDNVEADAKSASADTSGWDEVRRTKSPWTQADKFGGREFRFKHPALMEAWKTIITNPAQ